jgi:hypothetical protein
MFTLAIWPNQRDLQPFYTFFVRNTVETSYLSGNVFHKDRMASLQLLYTYMCTAHICGWFVYSAALPIKLFVLLTSTGWHICNSVSIQTPSNLIINTDFIKILELFSILYKSYRTQNFIPSLTKSCQMFQKS